MNDSTRIKPLKIYVNDNEEAQVRRTCAALGETVSSLGRKLLLQASAPAHRKPRSHRNEGPKQGPASMRFPAHRAGACRPMRL
jgi:hypothetical protein